MADDKAAFGVFPQMKPRRSKQDREAAKTFPLDVARGFAAGALGTPADILNIPAAVYSMATGKDMPYEVPYGSEHFQQVLPGKPTTPTGEFAGGLGALAGGFYTGPAAPVRLMAGIPRAAVRAGKDFVQSAGQTVSPLTVYHGSPHKFEKFDASKIGTGEGAQAYGHGLYFAESPGVASSYQRKLSDSLNPLIDGAEMDVKNPAHIAAVIMHDNSKIYPGMPDQAIENALYTLRGAMVHPDNKDVWSAAAKIIERGEPLPKVQDHKGHLYTVDLPDEKIARMLDWDKPLSEQPEVIKALKGTDYEVGLSQKEAEKIADQRLRQEAYDWADETGGDPVDFINNANWERYVDQVRKESGSVDSSITGKDLHRMIMRDEGYRPDLFDPENYQVGTSEALRGYGIPGIKYLDATSRQAGEGTRNFVVFPGEEDALTILERKKEGGEVKMAEGGAAFGKYTTGKKYQAAKKRAETADVNTIADPRTYAFVSGLLGEAPDQLGFSVMHPDYQGIQKAGEKGFTAGTILGVAPVVGPLTKGLPVGASIKPVGLPFYSRVDQVAKELPRAKGTGAEFMKELEKAKGVKPAEIQHRDLNEIKALPKMTKDQFLNELGKRPPAQLQEKVLGGRQEYDAKRLAQLEKEYQALREHPIDAPSFGEEKYNELIRLMNIRDQSTVNTLYDAAERATRSAQRAQQQGNRLTAEKYFREAEFLNTRAEKLDLQGQGQANPPKYDKYVLPGGQNYREILLKLPAKSESEVAWDNMKNFTDRVTKRLGYSGWDFEKMTPAELAEYEILNNAALKASTQPPQAYKSSHWQGEPNVLAHARVTDRTGPNGEKILHVEEIQSDWHQAARKARDKEVKRLMEEKNISKKEASTLVPENFGYGPKIEKTVEAYYETKDGQRIPVGFGKTKEEAEASIDVGWKNLVDIKYETFERKVGEGVPDAPFKKNWQELMMNRILADAAEKGYDRVVITPGAVQANRYKLSNVIDEINVTGRIHAGTGEVTKSVALDTKDGKSLRFGVSADGTIDNVSDPNLSNFMGKSLDDVVGKEMSKKIMEGGTQTISGQGLEIGGEGMKGFYDKMLPDYLNSLGKKYGIEVRQSDVVTKEPTVEKAGSSYYQTQGKTEPVHSFDITPEMRQEFTEKGFPMYSVAAPVGLGATQFPVEEPKPVNISDNPDVMMMEVEDRKMAVGGLLGRGAKAAKAAKEAPMIVVPSKLGELQAEVAQKAGQYGAKRVQRAADEIKNLEKMYNRQALRETFLGDNAKAVVTMNPADFEKYAQALSGRTQSDIGPKMAELARRGEIDKYTVPTDEYIQHLMRVQGGFDQVPYLNLFKDEVGLPTKPQIKGHEGRHRSRALEKQGEKSSLVKIDPRGDLYEGLPRRSQEEYIEALRQELERSGRLVLPEVDGPYRRSAIELPEPYAKGGAVKKPDDGLIKVTKKRKAKA